MMSEIELETNRLVFSIEKEIVIMELREMLEKLGKIENELRKNVLQSQVVINTFKPCEGVVEPPKKKVRHI
jgi:hypothetical protein